MLWYLFFVFLALFYVFETGWWYWVLNPASSTPSITGGFGLLERQLGNGAEPFDSTRVVASTNLARKSLASLAPLSESPILDSIAKRRVIDMQTHGYFAHESPDSYGADDMARYFRYRYIRFGENIAFGDFASEADIVQAWVKSPEHRENILNRKFHEIGVASGVENLNGRIGVVIVQVFGLPVWDCPPVDESLLSDITAEQVHMLQMQQAATEILTLMKRVDRSTQDGVNRANAYVHSYNELVEKIEYRNTVIQKLNEQYNAQVKAFNACV